MKFVINLVKIVLVGITVFPVEILLIYWEQNSGTSPKADVNRKTLPDVTHILKASFQIGLSVRLQIVVFSLPHPAVSGCSFSLTYGSDKPLGSMERTFFASLTVEKIRKCIRKRKIYSSSDWVFQTLEQPAWGSACRTVKEKSSCEASTGALPCQFECTGDYWARKLST